MFGESMLEVLYGYGIQYMFISSPRSKVVKPQEYCCSEQKDISFASRIRGLPV